MPSSERLLLYAADAYRLSSLLLRRVFLEGDPMIMSSGFAERTRRILLDQARPPPTTTATEAAARPNVVAIALLHLDREVGLARYHGVREYASRWRSSFLLRRSSISSTSSGSSSSSSPDLDGKDGMGGKKRNDNVAKVAFLITSEQRRRLSDDLGYAHADVRTMTPREATLILEHGIVRRSKNDDDGQGGDWRTRLASLTTTAVEEEGGGSSKAAFDDRGGGDNDDDGDGPTTTIDVRHKRSSGESHRIVVKPDVAAALRSAVEEKEKEEETEEAKEEKEEEREDGRDRRRVHESSATVIVFDAVDPTTGVDDDGSVARNGMSSAAEDASVDDGPGHPSPGDASASDDEADVLSPGDAGRGRRPTAPTSSEPSELHRVKPDVAAAMMLASSSSSRRDRCDDDDADDGGEGDDGDGETGWYEVIERSPAAGASSIDDRIVALFQTREEAMECIRIKTSIVQGRRSRKEGMSQDEEMYLVRRRWVI